MSADSAAMSPAAAWYHHGNADGKQDFRSHTYRTLLMFSDAVVSFLFINCAHSCLYYGFYHFTETMAIDVTTTVLWCLLTIVPLILLVPVLLRFADRWLQFVPLGAVVFHALSRVSSAV
jgi:hypothetical protein